MGFSLLHAGLAAGAALAAVPIILHLFMKQTPKHIIFPALRLIRERQKRSRKKLRVKNWLLLLARMAMVALMALALARPALYSQANLGDREVPTALALVFDTSLSMEYTEKNQTRLAEAKKRAEEILRKTPETSQVFVVDSAEPGVPLPQTPSAAKKRIEGLTFRAANRPLNAAIGQAYRAVAESDRPRHEVYVLTDLARSSWALDRPVEGLDATKNVKLGVATYVLRLAPKDGNDLAVIDAQPSASVVTQGDPVDVKARVRASGAKKSTVVEFYLDKDEKGSAIKRGEKAVDIAANSETDVEFSTPSLAVGLHQGEVRIRGTDPMEFDDHRYISFRVQPALKVLVVSDLAIDSEFVWNAIDPSKLRSSRNRPFKVDRMSPAQLSTRMRESLKEYACVFLLNVRQLSESDWGRLNAFVREGGGLVIALGDRVDRESYNSLIAGQVVPATIGETVHPAEQVTFGKADFSHPLFNHYHTELNADLTATPVFRYKAVTVTPAANSRTILAFQDGAPALVERTFPGTKTGRVLLWTTPLSRQPDADSKTAWNDFPVSGWSFYYIIGAQTVPYLAGIAGEKLNYEAGEDVVLPIDPTKKFATYVVQGPDNKTSDRLSPLVSNPSLVIQAPQSVGHWIVTASGPGTTPEAFGFSINPPVDETKIAQLETPNLDALFGKDKYSLADDTDESLKTVVGRYRVGHELFPWIMAIILAVVTLENLLANKFYREQTRT